MPSVNRTKSTSSAKPARKPGIFCWLVALLTTGAFGAALYAADLASTGFHYAQLTEQLRLQLETAEDPGKVLLEDKYKALVADRKELVSAALGIYTYIENDNLSQALSWAKDPRLPAGEKKQELASVLEGIISAQKEKKNFGAERETTMGKKIEIAQAYLAIAGEFAEMLGYTTEAVSLQTAASKITTRKEAAEVEIAFYRSGVFEGFPVIEPLPDNLPNYLRVEQHLADSTRAKVISQLVREKSRLRATLGEIQERAAPLRSSADQLASEFGTINRDADDYHEEISTRKAQALALAGEMIEGLLLPEVDEKVATAYRTLRIYAAKWLGRDLPELNTA